MLRLGTVLLEFIGQDGYSECVTPNWQCQIDSRRTGCKDSHVPEAHLSCLAECLEPDTIFPLTGCSSSMPQLKNRRLFRITFFVVLEVPTPLT